MLYHITLYIMLQDEMLHCMVYYIIYIILVFLVSTPMTCYQWLMLSNQSRILDGLLCSPALLLM